MIVYRLFKLLIHYWLLYDNNFNLKSRKNIYNELEYKVFRIKEMTVDIEEQIKTIQGKVINVENKIKEVSSYNEKLLADRNVFM